jgi:hypothetical protein
MNSYLEEKSQTGKQKAGQRKSKVSCMKESCSYQQLNVSVSQEQSTRNNRQPKLRAPVIPTYGNASSAGWFMEILTS